MLVFGKVINIDEKNARVKLSLPDYDDFETDWYFVPQLTTVKDKSYNIIAQNTLVAACVTEGFEDGCVIGALYNDEDMCVLGNENIKYIKFEDGSEFKYDKEEHLLNIKVEGDVKLEVKGDVTSKIEGNLDGTINGNVSSLVKGNVSATVNGTLTGNVLTQANITAPEINSKGVLNHVGDANITGGLNVSEAIVSETEVSVQKGNSRTNLSTHKHSGVQGGSSQTGSPV